MVQQLAGIQLPLQSLTVSCTYASPWYHALHMSHGSHMYHSVSPCEPCAGSWKVQQLAGMQLSSQLMERIPFSCSRHWRCQDHCWQQPFPPPCKGRNCPVPPGKPGPPGGFMPISAITISHNMCICDVIGITYGWTPHTSSQGACIFYSTLLICTPAHEHITIDFSIHPANQLLLQGLNCCAITGVIYL